jgi:SAM-dependent methyltransferase
MEYWESRFKDEGIMWKFEPADSTYSALKMFQSAGFCKILIPGMGYGRNAKVFHDNGFEVTGIEISQSAIHLAKENGLTFKMHCGSVTQMPFDNELYDGIFCYALVHLLNKAAREQFLKNCYSQLKPGGIMIFTVASVDMSLFGSGKRLSENRFRIAKGLEVYFYDNAAIEKEFLKVGLTEYHDITEPVKFMENQEPVLMKFVVCRKPIDKC